MALYKSAMLCFLLCYVMLYWIVSDRMLVIDWLFKLQVGCLCLIVPCSESLSVSYLCQEGCVFSSCICWFFCQHSYLKNC